MSNDGNHKPTGTATSTGSTRPTRLVVTTTVPVTAYELMRGQLRWLAGHGMDVHLVSSPGPLLDRAGAREGVTTHSVAMRRELKPLTDLWALGQWIVLLYRLRPDMIYFGTPKAGLLAGMAAALLRVPRRVYLLRGLRYEGAQGISRTVLRIAERLTCRTAHLVVAVSPSLARVVTQHRVVPADKVTVIGHGSSNGVDTDVFRPPTRAQRVTARAAAGVPEDAVVIGFVGRLNPDKGLACLEEAFAILRQQLPDVRLLLIGAIDTNEGSAIAASPGVTALGAIDDPAQRYAALDIVCLPTRREGFPNVVLEASSCAIPVVTTYTTGAVDSVIDQETGLLVPVDDPRALAYALESLCRDSQRRADLGAKARQRVLRDFRPTDIWHGLLDVL